MLYVGSIHRKEYDLDADRSETVVIAEAPGRIHFLGEHGEPKAGLFLSSTINRRVRVAVSSRKDASLRFYAANAQERKRASLVNLKYKREDRWANYIKAAVSLFVELGCPVKGLNFTLWGDIPQHVGLGSSQAVEIAAALALREFLGVPLDNNELLIELAGAQEMFFGKAPPPMDYLIALNAEKDTFILSDETTMSLTPVASALSEYTLLLTDSRVPRAGVEEELRERRRDIKKGLEILNRKKPRSSLREVEAPELTGFRGGLSENIRRRSAHIINEAKRVREAAEALARNDPLSFARAVTHSQENLRDLYEVSCPEIDWLIKRAQEIDGVLCSRMTGRGFGGCTYTFLQERAQDEYRRRLDDYERIFGFHPVVYEACLGPPARLILDEEDPVESAEI
ncbi:MAG: galactokinase [Spirochaetaceae bacterium]|jgi:galactokinase|nr:galactokinase [Spirochaetaceae bacterium]